MSDTLKKDNVMVSFFPPEAANVFEMSQLFAMMRRAHLTKANYGQ